MLKKLIKSFIEKDIHEFIVHSKNYLTAAVFTKALGFITIPIFTRLIPPDGYGAIAIYISIVGIVSIIATLGIDSSIKRYYFEEENSDLQGFLSTNILFAFVFLLLMIMMAYFFENEFINTLNISSLVFYAGVITGSLIAYKSIYIGYLQAAKQSKKIRNIKLFFGLLVFILSILLVVSLHQDKYLGLIYANTFSALMVFFYVIVSLKKFISRSFFLHHFIYSLKIGLPFVLNQLAGYILVFFDRIMISSFYGLAPTGLYSLAYNVGMLMDVFVYSLSMAWVPMLFERKNLKKNESIVKLFTFYSKIVLLACFFLILFSKEIVLLIADKQYHSSLPLVNIIIISYLFKYLYSIYASIEYYYKKTLNLAIFSIIAGMLNIVLNYYCLPIYGYEVAAVTTLISYIFLFALHYTYVTFILKDMTLPITRILGPFLILTVFIFLYFYLNNLSFQLWTLVFVKLFLLICITIIFSYPTVAKEVRSLL